MAIRHALLVKDLHRACIDAAGLRMDGDAGMAGLCARDYLERVLPLATLDPHFGILNKLIQVTRSMSELFRYLRY